MGEHDEANAPEPAGDGRYKIVAMAASAGGLAALSEILSGLPEDFPAAIVVVQHLSPHHRSYMAEILSRRTALHVRQALGGELLSVGQVYVAPPDRHLLVNPDGTISLSQSELVHFVRPSADLLFLSVAGSYGPRAIALVLTGTGKDGSMGAKAITDRGGTVIVQDRATAEFKGMPEAAIERDIPDFILPLEQIAGKLIELVQGGGSN